ncbi:hypothetical protein [Dyella acidisoli]|uniref:hypothetical protein n=1 Tax=Dyella acidisoli TaxID=1867834 RepID=UPI0024E16BCD|nr:hypothetical protein [Dyella acidisoli]
MRDVIEGAIRSAVKLIFEVVIWDFALFHLGKVTLLVLTFGRYPSRKDCERVPGRIPMIGVAVLVIAWLVIAVFNNLHGQKSM